MRKSSLACVFVIVLAFSAVGTAGPRDAHAAYPPNVLTVSVYRSVFSPSMTTGTNGLVITLVNRDAITHRIVLDRERTRTSFDVTLAPGQRYTSPSPLSCTGNCSTVTYTYRDATLSRLDPTGYCNSFCFRVYLHANGT
jgi:hypothetical protein